MSNDHYISEFLIKPWKKPGESLWHYSFKDKKFSTKLSTDRLFASRNLWSEELEKFLGKHTEDFSAAAREKLLGGGQPNEKEFQSLFLLVLLQSARSGYKKGLSNDLEDILKLGESGLADLVSVAQLQKKFLGIRVPEDTRLFFPDTGIFPYPIQHEGSYEWAFMLPISGNFCLTLAPKAINSVVLEKQIDFSQLAAWSVGSSKYCEKIVIHPDYYFHKTNENDFENHLNKMRSFVDGTIANIDSLNQIISNVKLLFPWFKTKS